MLGTCIVQFACADRRPFTRNTSNQMYRLKDYILRKYIYEGEIQGGRAACVKAGARAVLSVNSDFLQVAHRKVARIVKRIAGENSAITVPSTSAAGWPLKTYDFLKVCTSTDNHFWNFACLQQ